MRTSQQHEPTRDLLLTVSACEMTLIGAGQRFLGKVREGDRAIDLALVSDCGQSAVVRCVTEPQPSDHIALKKMLAQGDFTRAAIVYTAEEQPHLTGEIEAYPISRIDELAASLARESAP